MPDLEWSRRKEIRKKNTKVDTVCPAAVSVSADKNADCGG